MLQSGEYLTSSQARRVLEVPKLPIRSFQRKSIRSGSRVWARDCSDPRVWGVSLRLQAFDRGALSGWSLLVETGPFRESKMASRRACHAQGFVSRAETVRNGELVALPLAFGLAQPFFRPILRAENASGFYEVTTNT